MALIDRILSVEFRVIIRRLLVENAAQYWLHYAVAFALMAVVGGATAYIAYIMRDVINEIFVNGAQGAVNTIALLIFITFLVRGVATYISSVILFRVGNAIIQELQGQMARKLLSMGSEYYDRFTMGEMITRFNNNTNSAREAIRTLIVSVGRDAISLIGLAAVMVIQDPGLSLFAVVAAPPAIIFINILSRRMRKITRRQIDLTGGLTGSLKDLYFGANTIKSYNMQAHMGRIMEGRVRDLRKLANKGAQISTLTVPVMDILGGMTVAAVILYSGYRLSSGGDPGALFSFITALLLAYEPARRLARVQVQLQAQLVGVKMLYDLLDAPSTDADATEAQALEYRGGEVVFDDVSFGYRDEPVLRGFSATFAAGQTTALVGPSGAGKTTVFSLLERFRQPDSGTILIDGQSIDGVTGASLRQSIAFVSQATFLFNTSIRENIAFGREGATDEEIEAAARAANAHDFIVAQPDGYDTIIGEDGSALSGGQRQRVAIARAILRDAPIVLLDEATSALDTESEAKVQAALARLMGGRTTIVIAHRLSTVRSADRIHVMEAGKLVESGTHAVLLEKDGVYARLHTLQFQDPQ
ncbi:MAG: ABC transporter ATP-binding protein [Pseudomonadota bacterium]